MRGLERQAGARRAKPKARRRRKERQPCRARLRRADCSGPGIRRRRQGRGFDLRRRRGQPGRRARRSWSGSPSWRSRRPGRTSGSARIRTATCRRPGPTRPGRKQYRYHDEWRLRRDREKFDDMLEFAHALPALRRRVARDLGDCTTLDQRCVLALAVRLLDVGFFRIGSEEYASENDSYGLATLRKEHLRIDGRRDGVRLPRQERPAPPPGDRRRARDARSCAGSSAAAAAAASCSPTRNAAAGTTCARGHQRLPQGGDRRRLLRQGLPDLERDRARGGRARGVGRAAAHEDGAQARDHGARSRRSRRYLGNTPAVCRASYIDPRVLDAYDAGVTIRARARAGRGEGRARPAADPPARSWSRRCSTSSASV